MSRLSLRRLEKAATPLARPSLPSSPKRSLLCALQAQKLFQTANATPQRSTSLLHKIVLGGILAILFLLAGYQAHAGLPYIPAKKAAYTPHPTGGFAPQASSRYDYKRYLQRRKLRLVARSVIPYAAPPYVPNVPTYGPYASQLIYHRNRMLYRRSLFLQTQRLLYHDEPQRTPPYHIYQQHIRQLNYHRQRMQYHYNMIQHYLRMRNNRHHYRRHHYRRRHYHHHRRHYPSILRPRHTFRSDLGSAGTWYDPQNQHLTMDVNILQFGFSGRTPSKNYFGFNFKLLRLDNDGWKTHWTRPYDWLEKWEWGHLSFYGHNRFFGIEAGFLSYRGVHWSLNDLNEALTAQGLPKTSLMPESLQIMLPSLKVAVQFPGYSRAPVGFSLAVGAQLLQWDFQSFRAYTEAQLSFSRVLRVTARATYQQEQSLLQPEKKKNDCGCISTALWSGRFWEGQLKGQLDIFSLFGRKEGRASFWKTRNSEIWGPIFLDFGVRVRQVDVHQIINPQEKILFKEAAGLGWAFFVGLRLGADNTVLFMQ
ncbi:MAG: hypothetical protein H6728_12195 [Myxococcales bacterium]|nr:hypothetical protein [Myxococcales bacterium]